MTPAARARMGGERREVRAKAAAMMPKLPKTGPKAGAAKKPPAFKAPMKRAPRPMKKI